MRKSILNNYHNKEYIQEVIQFQEILDSGNSGKIFPEFPEIERYFIPPKNSISGKIFLLSKYHLSK